MKILLDENLPHKLRLALPGHEVATASYMGWAAVKNGELLKLAEQNGFQVFITADQNLRYQQNLAERRISLIVVTSQWWELMATRLDDIVAAINTTTPGAFTIVDCGRFQR